MRKIFTLTTLAVLLSCSFILAEGEAKAKKKQKPKAKVTFNGDVQYRWRSEIFDGVKKDGTEWSNKTGDFQHIYAFNFKMKAVMSDNLCFGMRLSNPAGYAGDNIVDNVSKVIGGDEGAANKVLSIPEMYFKWKLNMVSLAGGVIPVSGNTVLDLVAFEEMCFGKGEDCWIGKTWWKVAMNNSQKGLSLGLNFVKTKEASFSLNIMNTIAEGAGKGNLSDALKKDQLRFIFSLPISLLGKKLAITPVMHLRTNMYRSADLEEANHALAGGIDIKVAPVKQLAIIAGIAVDGFKNSSQENDPGYDTTKTAPFGLLTQLAFRVKPGYGKGMLDIKYGAKKDREDEPVVVTRSLFYWDARYAFPIKGGLKIMPRVRAWHFFNNDTDNDYKKVHLRPALYFMASF